MEDPDHGAAGRERVSVIVGDGYVVSAHAHGGGAGKEAHGFFENGDGVGEVVDDVGGF